MNNQLKGLLIAFFGIVTLTPDPVLVVLADANTSTILFWRGIFYALGIFIILFVTYDLKPSLIEVTKQKDHTNFLDKFKQLNTFKELKKIGRVGVLIGFLSGIGGVTFIAAIQYISIAKVLVIISTAPLVVAVISWMLINEKPRFFTWISMVVIVIGIYIVMIGGTESCVKELDLIDDCSSKNLKGSLLALFSVIAGGYSFALTRKYSNINMVPAMIVNALVVSFIGLISGLIFSNSFYLPFESLMFVITGGFILAISFSLITIAPRFIPASEVAMFMPLGTILGTLSAWIFIGQEPSSNSLLGGSIVILTLFFHAWYSSKIQTK